jgi:hypothetical protein
MSLLFEQTSTGMCTLYTELDKASINVSLRDVSSRPRAKTTSANTYAKVTPITLTHQVPVARKGEKQSENHSHLMSKHAIKPFSQ